MAQESWKRDTEETGCQPPEGPVLCTNGCGFFGSAANMGLCSKCYRDLVVKQTKATSAKTAAEKVFQAPTTGAPLLDIVPETNDRTPETVGEATTKIVEPATGKRPSVSEGSEEPGQPRPNKCYSCKKRVGLTGFKCRCGQTFCSLHRYSDKHDCTFDYKTAGRDAIAKANPVVKADKVEKI